jgi:iron-sulfur cluster assembly protein
MITVTEKARDEMQRQARKRERPPRAMRLGLRGGGCTGFSYLFEWSDAEPTPRDAVIDLPGTDPPLKLYIDPKSAVYLKGTELDFVTTIMGHGFKFNNPNTKGTCGCGESVQF